MAIMAIQKKSSGNMEVLSKDKCMEVFKVQQELQLEMIDDIMKSGMLGQQPQSYQAQHEQMMKAMVQQAKSADRLFAQTGVEEEQLLYSIDKLELDKDQEFISLMSSYMMKARAKATQMMQAQGGAPGMGGGMQQMQGMF